MHAGSVEESSTGPAEGGRRDPTVGRARDAQQASVPERQGEGIDADRVLAGEESQLAEGGGDASYLLERCKGQAFLADGERVSHRLRHDKDPLRQGGEPISAGPRIPASMARDQRGASAAGVE